MDELYMDLMRCSEEAGMPIDPDLREAARVAHPAVSVVAELRKKNTELQQRVDELLAENAELTVKKTVIEKARRVAQAAQRYAAMLMPRLITAEKRVDELEMQLAIQMSTIEALERRK